MAFNLLGAAVIAAIAYALATATGNFQQWIAVGIGYYAIFSWASTLKRRDAPTFKLIWGTPAFLTTILGYGMVAFMSYAASFWAAPYAIRILEEAPSTAGWWIGGPGAVGGFLGVIMGGRAADWLRERNPAGRLIVVAFGLAAAAPFLFIMFTTQNTTVFYITAFCSPCWPARPWAEQLPQRKIWSCRECVAQRLQPSSWQPLWLVWRSDPIWLARSHR